MYCLGALIFSVRPVLCFDKDSLRATLGSGILTAKSKMTFREEGKKERQFENKEESKREKT